MRLFEPRIQLQTRTRVLSECGLISTFAPQSVDLRFLQALKTAGITDPSKCYFVDDSLTNVKAARTLGWGNCVHFCERGLLHVEGGKPKYIGSDIKEQPDEYGVGAIAKVDELRGVWPEIFKQ